MKKKTYMTLLSSDNYIEGVLSLNYQLQLYKCEYPLTVLITQNVSKKVISKIKNEDIAYIVISKVNLSNKHIRPNIEFPNWSNTFSKLLIFGMTEFEKIVFLDADMMILDNLDELFTKKNLSAVVAGKSYPGNEKWCELNSGLMVIKPKPGEDERLIELINAVKSKTNFGDQDIIQMAYPHWKYKTELHLAENYNVLFDYESYYLAHKILNGSLKVLHFTGAVKPWNMTKHELRKKHISYLKFSLKNKSLRGYYSSVRDLRKYLKICSSVR